MRHSFKNAQIELTVILIILQLLLSPLLFKNVIQAETAKPRVLFLSSYSQSFESDPQKIEGAQSVFQGDYDMDVEYMDSKRFETPENKALFYQLLKYKLSNIAPYDAIIVADDYALQFALDFQDDLFKEIPIVFIGINDKQRAVEAADRENIAGIWEETSLVENIELAIHFNPKAAKVMAIVDSTITGQGDQKQFEESMLAFPDLQPEILNVSNYNSFDEVASILEGLDDDTILLFLSMNQAEDGVFMPLDDQFEFLKNHTNIPVYRASLVC
ncbi:MAG: hypothetical protein PWP16_1 [Eubacteriaceae bacterium]|nr:hypothetical protein [Eubacteriaceae bacterium]